MRRSLLRLALLLLVGAPLALPAAEAHAQDPYFVSITPNPAQIPSPTSTNFNNGISDSVTVTVEVGDPGASQTRGINVTRQQVYASPFPDTLWVWDHQYSQWEALPADQSSQKVGGGMGPGIHDHHFKVELQSFTADGTYTERLYWFLDAKSGAFYDTAYIDITISVSGLSGGGSTATPTMTLSVTSVGLGTAGSTEFGNGTSASGRLTVDVSDADSVGTRVVFRLSDPYTTPVPDTVQITDGGGTWKAMLPRASDVDSASCTGTCSVVRDFRKLLHWASDTPGGPYTSRVDVDLKDASGTLLESKSADLTLTVGQALSLGLTNGAIDFGTQSSAGYATTATETTLTHGGNTAYNLLLQGDAAYMASASATNDSAKVIGHLEWSPDAGTTWNVLSTTSQTILSGVAPRTPTGDTSIGYRVLVQATDPKDTYTASFTYSVLAQ